MYTYNTTIKLHETDAAGLLFFSNQFKLIHDAYETLLEEIGFGFGELIRSKDYFLPIIHAQADYKRPVFVGDILEIQVRVTDVGETSFTFEYDLLNASKEVVGTAKTVHVTMNQATNQKIPLPNDMRLKIESLYQEDHK